MIICNIDAGRACYKSINTDIKESHGKGRKHKRFRATELAVVFKGN